MKTVPFSWSCASLITLLLVAVDPIPAIADPSFERDVRPILADHCFRCHGSDAGARQAGLRLDQVEGATGAAESGMAVIVPLQPDQSELIRRVTSDDPDVRMPPPSTGKALSATQVETLRKWIQSGARYTPHWSFQPPVSRPVPRVENVDWPRNVIDLHVLSRLEKEGLRASSEADSERLLRRLTLDLTGLPPTPEELGRFLNAVAFHPESAYEAEVERLLSSPHFGERLAMDWLDAARYADTNGYFGDKARQMWPWRDWVIRAFNDNMPFDQFTIEQLAGDLLPDATREQRVATGFHRNAMANNETGIIDEEYRVEAIADRVDTTGTVWLGLTIGCAQCHDHKFDSISQREYYEFFAFFNQSIEKGLVTKDDPPPTIDVPTPEQEAALRLSREKLQQAEQDFKSRSATLDADVARWEMDSPTLPASVPEQAVAACNFDSLPGRNAEGASTDLASNPPDVAQKRDDLESLEAAPSAVVVGTSLAYERGIRGDAARFDATQHIELKTAFDADHPWTMSVWLKPTGSLGCVWSKIEPAESRRGVEMIWQKGRLQVHLVHRWGSDEIAVTTRDAMPGNDWHHVILSYDGTRQAAGLSVIIDGQDAPLTIRRDTLTGSIQCLEPVRIGRRDAGLGYYGLLDEFRILPRAVTTAESADWSRGERLRGILARPAAQRPADEQTVLREYFIRQHAQPELRESWQRLRQVRQEESAARREIPSTLVMQDLPERRKTYLLVRGEYNRPGEEVQPGVPKLFPRLPNGATPNRLTLAHWLVSADNPLTARVAVNRLWQMCFGEGLVRTPNDFGSQGELPTHRELLDELAVLLIDTDWDVKGLLRLMMTSATYRQSSQASPELLQHDPDNRLLARGPRFRLPAELVRDQVLAVSGLLSAKLGGPSVKPYQPEGLWEAVSYNAEETYVPDRDDGLWRRSLYSYWKRQSPPPALLLFDANTREKCVVRRSRTNTPLQALVVLNDVTYVEAARALATRVLLETGPNTSAVLGPGGDEHRLRSLFRRAVSRWPEPPELQVLVDLLARERAAFTETPAAGERLVRTGASPPPSWLDPRELASWTLVAHTVLNLDEILTRR